MEIHLFAFTKIHLKMSAKHWQFLSVLMSMILLLNYDTIRDISGLGEDYYVISNAIINPGSIPCGID